MLKRILQYSGVFISAFVLLIASNCKNPKEAPYRNFHYTLDDAKDYMYFKKGTWWVYQNNVTKEIDSVYVTDSQIGESSSKGFEEWSKNTTLTQELMDVYMKSDRVDGWGNRHEYHIWTTGERVNAYPLPERAYLFEKNDQKNNISGGGGVNHGIVFMHRFDTAWRTYSSGVVKLDSTLINYALNGHTFDTVRVFYIERDIFFPQIRNNLILEGGPSYTYYAKKVGLIKYVVHSYLISNNQPVTLNWDIKKYNIIQ